MKRLFALLLLLWAATAQANTCVGAAGGGNWTANGSWTACSGAGGLGPPLASDDVTLTIATGNMTVDTGAVARSVNLTGYAGVLTHTAGVTLTIGDGTAGLGNVALAFPTSGWTYTLGSTTTSAITFVSTSATQQTVNFGGQTTGHVTFNAASNGSWQYTGAHAAGATAAMTLTMGSLDLNGQTVTGGTFNSSNTNVRSLTLGAAALSFAGTGSGVGWTLTDATNLTFSGAASTITMTGSAGNFHGGSLTYGTLIMTTGNTAGVIDGNNTFATMTRTGSGAKTNSFTLGGNQTISGTLTLTGNSDTNRLLVTSDTLGTPRTLTAGTVTMSRVDFRDITGAGAGSWNLAAITGNSGDCGGNSGITFTTPATQTATGTASFTWSTHGWTSRVPLCQDDVSIPNAFVAGRTVTQDMPRAGKSIDWTGSTGSPTWTVSVTTRIYGGVTLVSGVSFGGSSTSFIFEGRGAFGLTNAGVSWAALAPVIRMVGGTLTLNDAWTTASPLIHDNGTFVDAGFGSTFTTATSNSGFTRVLTRTGNLTVSGTGAVLTVTATGLTHAGTGSTITISDTSSTSKTVAGGGVSTYGTLIITGGGTGSIDITGANTFASLTIGAPKTVRFTAATTTTFGAAPTCTGTLGNVITISSITAATHTLSLASGTVSCDYLSLTNSIATGGAAWYAGANSTNVSGNTGWIFTAPASTANSGFFQLMRR